MTTIQNTLAAAATQGSSTTTETKDRNEMDQEDFLRLMIAQMKSQDPTKPMDSQAYLGQLAQFSSLSALQGLQKSVDALANALLADKKGANTDVSV